MHECSKGCPAMSHYRERPWKYGIVDRAAFCRSAVDVLAMPGWVEGMPVVPGNECRYPENLAAAQATP